MELFGIGPLELFFIIIIVLLILGPKDMVKTSRMLGQFLRKTIFSPTWVDLQRKMRNLPTQLMREAGIEEEDLKVNLSPEELLNTKELAKDLTIDLDNPVPNEKDTKQTKSEVDKKLISPTYILDGPPVGRESHPSGTATSQTPSKDVTPQESGPGSNSTQTTPTTDPSSNPSSPTPDKP